MSMPTTRSVSAVREDLRLEPGAHTAAARHPPIPAGGLCVENIHAALEARCPLAVDISSGVETAPGKKDHEKIRSVIAAVRHFSRHGQTDSDTQIFKKT